MKTVVILDKEEFDTLKSLLNDAKIDLQNCPDISFSLMCCAKNVDEAIKILNKEE